jgi:predicted DNA-binding transcriptional regulator AlpA
MPKKPAAQRSPHELMLQGKRAQKRTHQRKFLTGPTVCQRYGISDMSLWRWLQDADLEFPQPTLMVRGRRFWDEAVLLKWEAQRIARSASPSEAA